MSNREEPITFTELSYALFDVEANGVLTTAHGNLAIFTVRSMAERVARSSSRNIEVIPVRITRALN